nr:MBL fold metallo-hydrolase [Parvularcula dongshanensis]
MIDTAPELRLQLTSAGVGRLDAVFYTHDHADQSHGIDDLRALSLNSGGERTPVYVDERVCPDLLDRFAYCFRQAEGSPYPAILDARTPPPPGEALVVDGPSGPLPVTSFLVEHGTVDALGFRIGPFAYSPDLNEPMPDSWGVIEGAETWIVDALRRRPHPSHAHLGRALEWIGRVGAKGVLTNLHIDMDYRTLCAELPSGVIPAHDGLVLEAEEAG